MKNQYDLLNDINNDFSAIAEISLDDAEKKAITNRVKKKIKSQKKSINKGAIVAAALALTITGSIFFTNENVLAAMTSIGQRIETFLGKDFDEYAPYKKEILLESEDKGIKFFLHEAMIDHEELFISTSVDYSNYDINLIPDEAKEYYSIIPNSMNDPYKIFLNGTEFESNGGSHSYFYDEENKTVDIFIILDMEDANLNEVYDVTLEITSMEVQLKSQTNPLIEGNWTLDFQINNSDIADATRTIALNKEISIEHDNTIIPITLEEIKTSPLSTLFTYRIPEGALPDYVDVELKFFDDNGKELDFQQISKSYTGDKSTYKLMSPINPDTITVQPVIITYDNFWSNIFNTKGEKVELNLK